MCSRLSLDGGLALIGSAGCYDAILAFELEGPWTSKLAGSRGSDPGLDRVIESVSRQSRKIRLLALEPDAGRSRSRILWFERRPDRMPAYSRREFDVERSSLAATIESLIAGSGAGGEGSVGDAARDILVCTHGARDACCGKFGFPIYSRFRADAAAGVRVWRTSHLGGHRFAPTLIDLPSGRMFGRVELSDVAPLLSGGAALRARLETIYRGCCALPEASQVVERQLWGDTGATHEEVALRCRVEAADAPDETSVEALGAVSQHWKVELETGSGAGLRALRATVAHSSAVVTPASCGRAAESQTAWRIVD